MKKAVELANLTGEEIAIDAYCGIGTIGMTAASKAKTVLGIELNALAVKDAIANARANHVTNIHFLQGDAGEQMTQMAEREVMPMLYSWTHREAEAVKHLWIQLLF